MMIHQDIMTKYWHVIICRQEMVFIGLVDEMNEEDIRQRLTPVLLKTTSLNHHIINITRSFLPGLQKPWKRDHKYKANR